MAGRRRRWWLAACVAGGLCAEGRGGEVQIECAIQARQYSWTVTNGGSGPIRWIEIPVYHVSSFVTPVGWGKEGSDPDRLFRARALEAEAEIGAGQSAVFGCAILYQEATQRKATVRVGFRDGAVVEVAGVPVPGREPWSSIWATPAVLVVMAGLVVLMSRRRGRRAAEGEGH